jgi:hypothetical protein
MKTEPPQGKCMPIIDSPFLDKIKGAMTKELLIRDEDVQVLHGFDSVENAKAYLDNEMFTNDVLSP